MLNKAVSIASALALASAAPQDVSDLLDTITNLVLPTYSTTFASVQADLGNVGLLAGAAPLTTVSLSTAAGDMQTVTAHFASATTTACQDAYDNVMGVYIPVSSSTQSDMNFLYGYRYINPATYDLAVSAMKACLAADNPSNLATLNSELDAAKASIVLYGGQIGLDWQSYVSEVNTAAGQVTLTAAEQEDVFVGYRIEAFGSCAAHVYDGVNLLTPPSDAITTINALETGWDFADMTEFNNYVTEQGRLYMLSKTTEWGGKLETHEDAIYAAEGYSDSSTPTLAQIKAYGDSFQTCMDTERSASLTNEAYYNPAEKVVFGLLTLLASVFLF